jgi:hypothetical protein
LLQKAQRVSGDIVFILFEDGLQSLRVIFVANGAKIGSKESAKFFMFGIYITINYMEVSRSWGTPSYHPFVDGIFHETHQPVVGDPPFMETPHILHKPNS